MATTPVEEQNVGLSAFRREVWRPSKDHPVAQLWKTCDEKLEHGVRKYGVDSWKKHDMLAEALNEIVDLENYAFLKWRQLRDIPETGAIKMAMERLVVLGQDAAILYVELIAIQGDLDRIKVPRSITGEDRVGVQG